MFPRGPTICQKWPVEGPFLVSPVPGLPASRPPGLRASRPPGQPALPAVHSAHDMFQPLSPLSGATVLSGEFFTTTTSPISELS